MCTARHEYCSTGNHRPFALSPLLPHRSNRASQISPEGAASILGRYKDDAHKAEQFPKDCQALATAQQIYAGAYP